MRLLPKEIYFARLMRRTDTDAERLLWWYLRDRRMGVKFRRQHPIGPFIADLAAAEIRLVVELDGGGHADPEKVEQDARRTEYLARFDWLVLRFWNHEVLHQTGAVLEAIYDAVHDRSPLTPAPLPVVAGRGRRI